MFLTALLATLSAGVGVAQQPVPRSPVIAEFGKCLVRQASDRSRAMLLTEIHSREERSRAGSLATGTGQCIGSRPLLSMRIGEIRGTVAAALLQEDRLAVERLRQLPAAAPVRPAPARAGPR